MNREIKFRAWDGKKMHSVCRLGLRGFSTDLWSTSPIACDSRYTESLQIMQFTGLLDKNGKEIYEGDILSVERNCLWDDGRHNIAVEFRHGCFVSSDNGTALSILNAGFRPQIIGNIYESPGLLK